MLGAVASVTGSTATVTIDGEPAASAKRYPSMTAYTPVVGHRVLLARIGSGVLILGRVS
jgi:hypothetical protein